MAPVARFWPRIRRHDPSDYQIEKWHRSLIKVKIELSRAGLVQQQQYEVHTKVRVPIDALDYEHNYDARTQSPCLIAAGLQLAVGRRGLGPREL